MQVTSVFQRQLATARETSERYLEDFKTPEQWTYQVHDKANHALWFAGHMGQTDNFLISLIAPEKAAATAVSAAATSETVKLISPDCAYGSYRVLSSDNETPASDNTRSSTSIAMIPESAR